MKKSYQLTNDYRIAGHLRSIFKTNSDAENLSDLMHDIDVESLAPLPIRLADCLVIYETMPIFGDFMFANKRSHLWHLLSETDQPMLLTDCMVSGKDGLVICHSVAQTELVDTCNNIISKQTRPSLCVNHLKDLDAVMYPLVSFLYGQHI